MQTVNTAIFLTTIISACLATVNGSQRDLPQILKKQTTGLAKVAFGSCFRNWYYTNRTDIFSSISETVPDVFIWTGDAVYANRAHWFFGITPVRFSLPEVDGFFTQMSEDSRNHYLSLRLQETLQPGQGDRSLGRPRLRHA